MSFQQTVFDIASTSSGSPSIFLKREWTNIIDQQSQSYVGNQSVLDTSAISNGGKWANYREAFLSIPMNYCLTTTNAVGFAPGTPGTSCDWSLGLKNWFGSIIHSFTLNIGGKSIVQQTPYLPLWNTFKLMTTLSYNDVITQGASIGFYPDDATAFGFVTAVDPSGIGEYNNLNYIQPQTVTGQLTSSATKGNVGYVKRQSFINFDPAGTCGTGTTYSSLLPVASCNQLWKSYIITKQAFVAGPPVTPGVFQIAIMAQVYLKHLCNFFENVPLLKGAFFSMTLNLNNCSVSFTSSAVGGNYTNVVVTSPLGGVSPIMLTSQGANQGSVACLPAGAYIASLSVGAIVLNTTQSLTGVAQGTFSRSVQLYIPMYTFNPVFETSYISQRNKIVSFTDIFCLPILTAISAGSSFSQIISNGISNIKSVLVLPFIAPGVNNGNLNPIQSPFSPAGGGPTSPLALLSQFQIQISGANALYQNTQYSFQQFMENLYGQTGCVNGGQVDGLTSGLIDQQQFENGYCYYYVNTDYLLPADESVPRSVQVQGINYSAQSIVLYVFVENGVSVAIDVLTSSLVSLEDASG